jgi:hypothetical protein
LFLSCRTKKRSDKRKRKKLKKQEMEKLNKQAKKSKDAAPTAVETDKEEAPLPTPGGVAPIANDGNFMEMMMKKKAAEQGGGEKDANKGGKGQKTREAHI